MSTRKMKEPLPEVDYSHLLPQLKLKIAEVDDFHKGSNWMRKQPDSTLLRFLQGHNGNVEIACQKMMNGSKKRWDAATDSWIEGYEKDLTPITVLVKGNWPVGITGRDHRGKPVMYNHFTAVDFPGLTSNVGTSPLLKHMIAQIESLLSEFPEGGAILILDLGLDGLGITFQEARGWIQSMTGFLRKLGAVMDCYPESFSRIIFTRAPKMFWATWKVAKNFIPERTLQKVTILSAEKQDPLKFLLEIMDCDAIPCTLNGTSRTILGIGGKVPKNALEDDDFITQMRAHVRSMQGDFSNGRQSARYSNLRTKAEENDIQEQLALELMKMQIEEAKANTSQQVSERGSWRFEPGLDVLESVEDEALLEELRNESFDPAKALDRLKKKAAKTEGISIPEDRSSMLRGHDEDTSEDDSKRCVIM